MFSELEPLALYPLICERFMQCLFSVLVVVALKGTPNGYLNWHFRVEVLNPVGRLDGSANLPVSCIRPCYVNPTVCPRL